MKTILSLCLACLCTLSAYAQQQPVTQVHTALNHLTVIEVGEPITMAAAGSDAFEIERHANRVFVKPTRAGVSTNLFVWTEHGRSVYELQPAADVSKMPTPNRQLIEVLDSEVGEEDVAPGQTSAGVLAIKIKNATPTLYQFVFGSDKVSPVVA